MTTCPSTGSTPDHMLPSLMALKPHSLSCWWRSGDNISGSYLTSNSPLFVIVFSFQFSHQGSCLMTELMPRKSLTLPSRSTN